MQTATTVSLVRSLYESLASSSAQFTPELNEITARLMNRECWHGATDEVLFPVSSDGYLVLPPQFIAVLGYDFNSIPRPVFSQFHQYMEMGIGWADVTKMGAWGLLDNGMVVSQKQISGTATLRVKPSLAMDAGKSIRFFGLDQNSQPIYTSGVEGITLTMAVPSSDTTQQFTMLTGIQAATNMVGPWTLWQVVNGQETQIGTYQPWEHVPNYRSYKIGIRNDQDVVRCYCRRKWIPVVNETDFVFPGCLPALKMGFKALQLEDANQDEKDAAWERSFNELDKEIGVLRGSELTTLRITGLGPPRHNVMAN